MKILYIFCFILLSSCASVQKYDPINPTEKFTLQDFSLKQKRKREVRKQEKQVKKIEKKRNKAYKKAVAESRKKHLNNQDEATRERIKTHLKQTKKYYKKKRSRNFFNFSKKKKDYGQR